MSRSCLTPSALTAPSTSATLVGTYSAADLPWPRSMVLSSAPSTSPLPPPSTLGVAAPLRLSRFDFFLEAPSGGASGESSRQPATLLLVAPGRSPRKGVWADRSTRTPHRSALKVDMPACPCARRGLTKPSGSQVFGNRNFGWSVLLLKLLSVTCRPTTSTVICPRLRLLNEPTVTRAPSARGRPRASREASRSSCTRVSRQRRLRTPSRPPRDRRRAPRCRAPIPTSPLD